MNDHQGECLCEAIFGFERAREQAQVRAFYGDAAYEAILKGEADQREQHAARAKLMLWGTDDVGAQWR